MCTEMDRNNAFIVYSGGDDCQWKSWDLRLPVRKPLYVNKFHSAGITCLFDNASEVLFCGSYDDSLSAWDKRSLTKPVDHIHVGGAAWTMRSDNEGASRRIVCACIHQGIVEFVTTESGKITLRCMDSVLGSQMVYAADWFCPKENSIVASSYSDRKVHLLRLPSGLNKCSDPLVPTDCLSEDSTCHGE
ncbi:WD40 domain containing protein [Trichuris trichiura]|uniref:methylated diphthine methylhydrolase n=1 Tax=Trichuris trichiura TaxID=36087 RepID=A0A077ZLN3_TRITR|nr:WD40 domain containing protein [Trichuris trichiura]